MSGEDTGHLLFVALVGLLFAVLTLTAAGIVHLAHCIGGTW